MVGSFTKIKRYYGQTDAIGRHVRFGKLPRHNAGEPLQLERDVTEH